LTSGFFVRTPSAEAPKAFVGSRIDPQHLAWCLDNLATGNVVNRISVPPHEAELARLALDRMLAVS
jgi:quinolinate synthase